MEPLHAHEIAARLEEHPDWELVDGKLRRELTFDSFRSAFGFMTQVAFWAEKLNHHPEWSNVYSRVEIVLTTHDAGGLTDLDFEMVEQIDRILDPEPTV